MAALLLPALGRAKQKATGAICRGNQKQLMLGFQMYCHDNNDRIVGPYYNGIYKYGGYWAEPIPAITAGMTMINHGRKINWRRITWQYVTSIGSYHCPGDLRAKRRLGLSPGPTIVIPKPTG